ncbi:MAG: phosphatase PAP2 family protein [Microbacterium sp.]|uniref:phosphatase PAP2 family protein n=1 Tax=Microbacterium sp. TaxID=51671 RepID=UPI003F9B59A7
MTRRAMLWWGVGALVAAVALGAATSGVLGFDATMIDIWWNGEMAQWRSDVVVGAAYVLNDVGGGWIATFAIPIAIAVVLLLMRRWRAAVFALLAFIISAGLVQALKHLFGRARPEDMLVLSDYGSFPSGHTANAATIAAVAVLLFPRVWTAIVAVAWVVAMALSRTLLSVHWMSDTIGGALVGIAASLLLAAAMLRWVQQKPSSVEGAEALRQ